MSSCCGVLHLSGSAQARPIEYDAQPLFRELIAQGLRSFLRVSVRLRGGVLGGLIFCASSRARRTTTL